MKGSELRKSSWHAEMKTSQRMLTSGEEKIVGEKDATSTKWEGHQTLEQPKTSPLPTSTPDFHSDPGKTKEQKRIPSRGVRGKSTNIPSSIRQQSNHGSLSFQWQPTPNPLLSVESGENEAEETDLSPTTKTSEEQTPPLSKPNLVTPKKEKTEPSKSGNHGPGPKTKSAT